MNSTTFYKKYALAFFTLLLFFTSYIPLSAQNRPDASSGGERASMNIGRFYGKVVDEDGHGVGYATVQLFGQKFDKESRSMKEAMIAGQITEDNGDFSLEKLPVRGDFTLKISILSYKTIEQKVTFGIPGGRPDGNGGGSAGTRPSQEGRGGMSGGNFDKDLGNITLLLDSKTLDEIVVKGEATNVKLALDRKIFRVDKDASAAGGTAEEALRNVPSLNIDIDGNLTLRNASPQLFVDGRPTTLSLDQISADEIETVEVITNPSAKYDASGGQAGIVNIVLKKERRIGYNGNVRASGDSQGGYGLGGNINARENKINVFFSGNYNNRVRKGESETIRNNLFGNPLTNVNQLGDQDGGGSFASARGGLDWFMNNRNTITFEGSYMKGSFGGDDILTTITDTVGFGSSESTRTSISNRTFIRKGGAILFKHLFPKQGKELTADVHYSQFDMDNHNDFETFFENSGFKSNEQQKGDGTTSFITAQVDYEEPLGETAKIEFGARATIKHYVNTNGNYLLNSINNEYIRIPNFADEYEFDDNVIAAYGTYSQKINKWGYMLGLRAESSRYEGVLPESGKNFENDFPLSLFPSAFVNYEINDKDNLQLSYTRRINRPSFFNLIPFRDLTDSLNIREGNADLLPEFTNSLELVYQNIFEQGDNLLISVYVKQASDLITGYQYLDDETYDKEAIISTYKNSNSSIAYGAEFTLRNTLAKNVELISNVNLYNSRVDASNIEANLINDQFTWYLKENLNIRMPKIATFQINGQYRSKAAFSPSSGGRGRHHGHGGSSSTAQGYSLASWYVDLSIRKDFFKRKASLSVGISDIFATRQHGSHSESEFFVQDSWRTRTPREVRLSFSYRFGKPDTSLFKRKNTKQSDEGAELMN